MEYKQLNLLSRLRKAYIKFLEKPTEFTHSAAEEEKFLQSFPEPENDIERAFFQYKCQKWVIDKPGKWVVMNLFSCLMFFPFLIGFKLKCEANVREKSMCRIAMTQDFVKRGYLSQNKEDEIKNNVKIYEVNDYGRGQITGKDAKFIFDMCVKHPFAFYFNFKCMCRIAAYSKIINDCFPKEIYTSAEYSFTSSALTSYCEYQNIKHINVMHGEKNFYIQDSFSRFHVFYVWDSFYVELFYKLRANKTIYIVDRPMIPDFIPITNNTNCTYYLQLHTIEQLKCIKKAMDNTGFNYLVRPHPIHYDREIINVFGEKHIEDPFKVSIWNSLKNAGMVVAVDSTVLLQAHWKNIPIALDDISNPHYTKENRDRLYIIFSKKHKLLSEIVSDRMSNNVQ